MSEVFPLSYAKSVICHSILAPNRHVNTIFALTKQISNNQKPEIHFITLPLAKQFQYPKKEQDEKPQEDLQQFFGRITEDQILEITNYQYTSANEFFQCLQRIRSGRDQFDLGVSLELVNLDNSQPDQKKIIKIREELAAYEDIFFEFPYFTEEEAKNCKKEVPFSLFSFIKLQNP